MATVRGGLHLSLPRADGGTGPRGRADEQACLWSGGAGVDGAVPGGQQPIQGPVLAALVRLASLITGSHGAEDLMEAVAETSLELLGADSVSISHLEDDGVTLRTLVNVGSLGDGEQRWPVNETYQVADFPDSLGFLLDLPVRRVATSVDDALAEPAEVALLRSLGKTSSLKSAILVDAKVWGELWAGRASPAAPFSEFDADLAQVIVGLVSAGVSQAAAWQQMQQLASSDPLTGLANRRGLDEHLRRHLARAHATGQPLTVAVGDVNGLKKVNDSDGHAAGDGVLLRVAAAATAAISEVPHALAARLGGDKFALVLPAISPQDALAVADQWCRDAADPATGTSLACGVAVTDGAGADDPRQLLGAADLAQAWAKRARSRTPFTSWDPRLAR